MPPKKETYKKASPIDHVRLRPDMYVGSTRLREAEYFVANKDDKGEYKITKRSVNISPAILRIFVEVLSNAIDNVERSLNEGTPCKKISVSISEDGVISVWNDGAVVPVSVNETEGCYNHSLIFGHLLTGSNYDDDEERLTSGRNGLGVKLTNIYSTEFKVVGGDPHAKRKLVQMWSGGMKETNGPDISSYRGKGYTEVTWKVDFDYLNIKDGYTPEILSLYRRFVIDTAMLTKIPVYLNDELIDVKSLKKYAGLYETKTDETLSIRTNTCEILVTPANEFQSISFVNGVHTRLGGQHVDAWSEALFRPLVNKFNKKDKPQINIKDVKQFFRLFVVSTVINPEFDGQDKNKLESPSVSTIVRPSHISTIAKWSVSEDIQAIIRGRELGSLKKVERKKRFTKIENLDDANDAGTSLSSSCKLIICEGLSAKTYAIAGIEQGVYDAVGRDKLGVYPLRGKVLNVRNATPAATAKNNVITDLIKALGLKYDIDYTVDRNFKTLRYGQLVILTDADEDGIHIEGLILNVIHVLFPSLLKRKTPYVIAMKTPIVRVFQAGNKSDLLFYDERKFREYAASNKTKFKMKYYKGLGTAKEEDVPDTYGLKTIEYINDDNTQSTMNKVFHKDKKYTDARKDWLTSYDHSASISLDDTGKITDMNISEFLDGELIKFSYGDCKRSLASAIDGLKESQRKILYAAKKRNLKHTSTSLKVAQFGGYVAEHTNYHHGEQNLFETITRMATAYPGSNNIPLLYRDGMFGTRLSGGKDASKPRYIFTRMDSLTHLIYPEEDDILLTPVIDDGDEVEPEFYVPIIPMILVNGSVGIGTGWSCTVPQYNPLDLIDCIKTWLEEDGNVLTTTEEGNVMSKLPNLVPWYRGFTGKIEKDKSNDRFVTRGVVERESGNRVVVSELPIGMWNDKFKDHVETLLEEKEIKDIKDYSTCKSPNYLITENKLGMFCDENTLKLQTYLTTSNMNLFDGNNRLRKFETIDEIIDSFCTVRFRYYATRKTRILENLEKELIVLNNKYRFIKEVIEDTLNIMNVKEAEIISILCERGYDEDPYKTSDTGGYDYLLRMQIRTFTTERIKTIKNDIKTTQNKYDETKKRSEKEMWIIDLDNFVIHYKKFVDAMQAETDKKRKPPSNKKPKK